MEKTKHTPGPLTVAAKAATDYYPPSDFKIVINKNAAFTAIVVKESDAILYASAPDLLEACQFALRRLEQLGSEDNNETVGPCHACELLRAAIAKAASQGPEPINQHDAGGSA